MLRICVKWENVTEKKFIEFELHITHQTVIPKFTVPCLLIRLLMNNGHNIFLKHIGKRIFGMNRLYSTWNWGKILKLRHQIQICDITQQKQLLTEPTASRATFGVRKRFSLFEFIHWSWIRRTNTLELKKKMSVPWGETKKIPTPQRWLWSCYFFENFHKPTKSFVFASGMWKTVE